MIHSFDLIDHIIPWLLLTFVIVFFVIYKTIYKKTDDDGQICLAIICALTFIGIISFELGNVIGFYGPSDATTHFKSHLVTTSDYRTVYKNNQNITITADHDTDFKSVALSAFMHDAYTTEDKIDKNLTESNDFTFTKNGVTKTERRATELIVVKNSPLKEESDISRRHIERIEFATRTYEVTYKGAKDIVKIPIARVTVSYEKDPDEIKKQDTEKELDKFINP